MRPGGAGDSSRVDADSAAEQAAVIRVAREEAGRFFLRIRILNVLLFFMPQFTFGRVRTSLYRLIGVKIGRRTLVHGKIELHAESKPWSRLTIGDDCQITGPLYVDSAALVTIGNHVAVGHHAMLITTSHDSTYEHQRCGDAFARPIIIEDGSWIGARATVLPGVQVGAGSIVGAGAVVTRDVPANTLVGGCPARVIRSLEVG